jgi:hypothetical protein
MNRRFKLPSLVLLGFVLSLAAILFAQRTSEMKLLVNGKNNKYVGLADECALIRGCRNLGSDYQRVGQIRAESDCIDVTWFQL